MPRIKEDPKTLLADLTSRLERLVEASRREGRESALAEIRGLVGSESGTPARRGPGRPRGSRNRTTPPAAPRKPRRNSWAGLTPEDRLARVNAIRKGKGLPPKDAL